MDYIVALRISNQSQINRESVVAAAAALFLTVIAGSVLRLFGSRL